MKTYRFLGLTTTRDNLLRLGQRMCLGFSAALVAVACGGTPEVVGGNGGEPGNGGTGGGGTGGSAASPPINLGGSAGSTDPEPESECANGVLEAGELCDDGNTTDGDGCSADCLVQDPNYDCSVVGEPCINQVICGNGRLEGMEACDDGNTDDDDGCSGDCTTVEDGWVCPRPDRACIELPVCGNSTRERGEQCDDGQATPEDGDGCSATCQLEDGFICRLPGEPCIPLVCGDGVLTPDEGCDDGDSPPAGGDGCDASCEVEPGYRCSGTTCAPVCGDGLVVQPTEQCDDGGRASGDGCSSACRREPFFVCNNAEPTVCTSDIRCGNSRLDPGEMCDPPGTAGCLAGCVFPPPPGTNPVCNNGIIERGEECDRPGTGCSATCQELPGFDCIGPNNCIAIPRCGDGRVNAVGEACDDGNTANGDGCTSTCAVQAGWSCSGLVNSVCRQQICGNGVLTSNEQCDDGNTASGDGCTASCTVTNGWVCPEVGELCVPRCGDGVIIAGREQCDDRNTTNGDGCTSTCRSEPGFRCPVAGSACVPAVCPNNVVEPGEGCDDNNLVAGDGCGPTCQLEPVVTVGPNPTVAVVCGDGLLTSGEECDDGNATNGDGCSSGCDEESGFTCTSSTEFPDTLDMRVTYRDFRAGNATAGGGHPDFQYQHLNHVPGITGAPCTTANTATCGRLNALGKMPLVVTNRATTGIRDANTFALWFQNANTGNVMNGGNPIVVSPFTRTLPLGRVGTTAAYRFTSTAFFPLDGVGFGGIGDEVPLCNVGSANPPDDGVTNVTGSPACDECVGACQDRNFNFTTELRYFFQYQGGETLTFFGDDDVWVYINGRLAVDIGGLHSRRVGQVVLGDDGAPSGTDSNCSVHAGDPNNALPAATCYTAAEQGNNQDTRFGLTEGNVYEIVFFHAERHTSASNFQLTLSGFLAPRSVCTPICGDGIVVPGEACDDGAENENGVSGACNTSCTARAFCGDGVQQTGEACDNGQNLDAYVTMSAPNQCAPGCTLPARCGDSVVQGTEQCDLGGANNNNAYGPNQCRVDCRFGGFCGDGVRNGTEVCDLGANNGGYGTGSCTFTCQAGPRCGDGVINGENEQCDGGANCTAGCLRLPFCGDAIVSAGEDCDWGQFGQAMPEYGECSNMCTDGPGCGDGIRQSAFEECDDGALNTGAYDACTMMCTLGPRCGDGTVQSAAGEACDNGVNTDTYAFDAESCGPMCTPVPFCGDGDVEPAYEFCDEGDDNDDNAYDGCTTMCEFGPYCGDGVRNGAETCDEGPDNRAYSPDGEGCGYDCEPSPYCGDGERNGPEQCDLGTDGNTGEYGTCNEDCTVAARCGDGVVQARNGEQCDDGPTGSLLCSSDCLRREVR